MAEIIDIGKDFSTHLLNRDVHQGTGKNTAIEFRRRFLKELTSREQIESDECFIILDFGNVKVFTPSFANEAFTYFTNIYNKEHLMKKIHFTNMSVVKAGTLEKELNSGYNGYDTQVNHI